jgi:hypothetical protein
MRIESSIRNFDQRFVEPLLAALAGLVAGHEHHGPPHGNCFVASGSREDEMLRRCGRKLIAAAMT